MKSIAVVILALACVPVLVGCKSKPPTHAPTLPSAVQEGPTLSFEGLAFKKTYTVGLTNERVLTVNSVLLDFDTDNPSYSASVTQADGKSIDFDCDKIADKIIEPGLISQLTQWCQTIHASAEAYWKANNPPPSFTDDKGRVWVLKTN